MMLTLFLAGLGLAAIAVFASGRSSVTPQKRLAKSLAVLGPPILARRGVLNEAQIDQINAAIERLGEPEQSAETLQSAAPRDQDCNALVDLISDRRHAHTNKERDVLVAKLRRLAEEAPDHNTDVLEVVLEGLLSNAPDRRKQLREMALKAGV